MAKCFHCKKDSNVLFPTTCKIFVPEASEFSCKVYITTELLLCRKCFVKQEYSGVEEEKEVA